MNVQRESNKETLWRSPTGEPVSCCPFSSFTLPPNPLGEGEREDELKTLPKWMKSCDPEEREGHDPSENLRAEESMNRGQFLLQEADLL